MLRPLLHGRTPIVIEGEGATGEPRGLRRLPQGGPRRTFRFCRLFPDLPPLKPDDAPLIALGQAMAETRDPAAPDSPIPAGFTYFGQFLDHDLTFDRTEGLPDGSLDPEEIMQGRSPALELDSLYGRGNLIDRQFYTPDRRMFRIGNTTPRDTFGVLEVFPNDLPRRPLDDVEAPQQAIIGDPRNDENLIVAQLHLAFLKFHNTIAEAYPKWRFGWVRNVVVQHYQSIVLHDFLPRIIDPDIYAEVLEHGRTIFFPGIHPRRSDLCMPVEFSVAAYRLGHSLIRDRYAWNRVFSPNGVAGLTPSLRLFFTFSGVSGDLGGEPTLPSDWVADWRRMFDFAEQPGGTTHPEMNRTRLLDTQVAQALQTLPEFAEAEQVHLQNLAVRNLLRGRLVGLPSGQAVAQRLGVDMLSPEDLRTGDTGAVVHDAGFDVQTPLWFYVLKEAEVQQDGQKLGSVGSTLVMEILHGLLEGSQCSILREDHWEPDLPHACPGHFTMTDLLTYVGDINPLGD